jgi:glutamate dehydrogenase (NAD(P)+)
MGGTDYDREGIAGLGVAVAGATMMEEHGENPSQGTFAVQGMGAMGAAVLRYFADYGAKLAALGDPKYGGTWTFDKPLSDALHRALINQDGDEAVRLLAQGAVKVSESAQDVLYQKAGMLFPCAVQNVLREDNVRRIQARYVCEGANAPVTPGARTELERRGIGLVPDFIANSGGIIAAFVELTSNTPSKAEEAKTLAREKISANVHRLFSLCRDQGCEPQDAGMYMALSRIQRADAGQFG